LGQAEGSRQPLGEHADTEIAKDIACDNQGIFTAIEDGGDLRTKMGLYFQYFAAGVVNRQVVWSEPFGECCGMGNITTASKACYDTSGDTPKLIGVASSSIPISFIPNTTLEDLLSRSQFCTSLSLTEEEIEELRGEETCAYDYTWVIVVASVFGGICLCAIGFFAWSLRKDSIDRAECNREAEKQSTEPW